MIKETLVLAALTLGQAALPMATPTLAAAETSEIKIGAQNAEIPQRLPLKQCLEVKIPEEDELTLNLGDDRGQAAAA
jgi:hypothetical protein